MFYIQVIQTRDSNVKLDARMQTNQFYPMWHVEVKVWSRWKNPDTLSAFNWLKKILLENML